jgi:hypothetical protein
MTTTDPTTEATAVEALLDRYFDTWNETDATRRLALCEQVWASDGRYTDPLLDAVGPAAISDGLGGLQAQMPGHRVDRSTAIDAHHDRVRFGWTVTSPGGDVVVAGVDVAALDADGKLSSIAGFFGELEAEQ